MESAAGATDFPNRAEQDRHAIEKGNHMRKDLTGRRFGRLTAVGPTDKRTRDANVIWSLRCDCGNTCEAPTSELLRGRVTSCGCARRQRRGSDLSGERFGKLEVVGRRGTSTGGAALWDCRCDCGNGVVVSTRSLRRGKRDCGCSSGPRLDLAGERFGRLVAVRPVGRRSGYVVWECRCDCGNLKDVTTQLLVTGRTRSCGCLRAGGGASHEAAAEPAGGDAAELAGRADAAPRAARGARPAAPVRPGDRFGDVVAVDAAGEGRDGSPAWRCVSDAGEVRYLTEAELAARRAAAGEGAA